MPPKNKLSAKEIDSFIATLKDRFDKNPKRHKSIDWKEVEKKLRSSSDKLWSLSEMERTGGEPDVVGFDKKANTFLFMDCATESPLGRRSICYDKEGLESRKEFKPENNALDMATAMGVTLLTEEQYRYLQTLGKFDAKTSSWILTPSSIRKLGGALFCDYRFETVFVYHNGAQSYYAGRGFRAALLV